MCRDSSPQNLTAHMECSLCNCPGGRRVCGCQSMHPVCFKHFLDRNKTEACPFCRRSWVGVVSVVDPGPCGWTASLALLLSSPMVAAKYVQPDPHILLWMQLCSLALPLFWLDLMGNTSDDSCRQSLLLHAWLSAGWAGSQLGKMSMGAGTACLFILLEWSREFTVEDLRSATFHLARLTYRIFACWTLHKCMVESLPTLLWATAHLISALTALRVRRRRPVEFRH